ncbi:hypothetical protein [Rhizobium rhizogenes]|uniref:hypothetical protein n=1 Tax=Rhizobium rhizogenes TaxID=359 RepID=UPI0015741484|nr:hypothetical protein [Rhizobium rhizogenes]NTG07100.1 hypothetical protein [Rhizobium rhizogenes]
MTMITAEMIKAARLAYWTEVHHGGGYGDVKPYEAAISAALALLPGEPVAVKALEWSDAAEPNDAHPVGAGDGNTYVPNYYGSSDARLDRQAIEIIEELESELAEALGFASVAQRANKDLSDLLIENGVLVPQKTTMDDILREQLEKPNFPRIPKTSSPNPLPEQIANIGKEGGSVDNPIGKRG